jgi:hypothetical protein
MWFISTAALIFGTAIATAQPSSPSFPPADELSAAPSAEYVSHIFTTTPDLFEEWRSNIAPPDMWDKTDISTNNVEEIGKNLFDYFYGNDIERYESKMASVVHGGTHMKPALVRSLVVLGILSDMGKFKHVKMPLPARRLHPKQIVKGLALTFKMYSVTEPAIIGPLKMIIIEEDLCDADLLPLVELIGEISAHQQFYWFINFFSHAWILYKP